jgi:putative FmdB family regulatory protein
MTYNYHCDSCNGFFEKNIPISDREKPIKRPCPICKKKGQIIRIFEAPSINYEGAISDLKRAGSGWNDVLNRVKKYGGRHSTVETR